MTNPFQHERRRNISGSERARMFAKVDGHCQKCTRKIPHGDDWEVDHRTALSRGGTNDEDNLWVVCSWCHSEKTSDDLSEAAKSKRIYTRHVVPSRHLRSRSWGRKW